MPPPKSTGPTGKSSQSTGPTGKSRTPAPEQQILTFRDPEELRLARVSQFRSLSDALYSSIDRSTVRKDVALTFFPQKPTVSDPVGRAESRLAHKLGPSRDQKFDVDLVLKVMKMLQPDEQIDVLVYMLRECGLDVVDGRILPRARPSKGAAVDALRKDVTAMFGAVLERLDSIAGSEDE